MRKVQEERKKLALQISGEVPPPSEGLVTFEKWQACGNDFILVRCEMDDEGEVISGRINEVKACDRHFGIGADGVIYMAASAVADVKIKIVNSDGSEAEMCGNGVRCVGRKVAEDLGKDRLLVETAAGVKSLVLAGDKVSVEMGVAKLLWDREITVSSHPRSLGASKASSGQSERPFKRSNPTYDASFVDVGNPHCVLFVEGVKGGEVERFGRKIELMSELFPNRTNVEFVTVEGRGKLRVRVWERGAGRTLACGTGACASAYAAWRRGLTEPKVEVELDGGSLEIDLTAGLKMTGPAERVYRGTL